LSGKGYMLMFCLLCANVSNKFDVVWFVLQKDLCRSFLHLIHACLP
jgi:hypothetical protein